MLREVIHCRGHENIKATHRSTLEITTEDYLTPRGDCIICVSADKALTDLNKNFKEALKRGARVHIIIKVGNLKDDIIAWGSPRLKFKSSISMVVRKSEYIDERTLAIRANKAAKDINRRIIEELKKKKDALIELIVI